MMDGRLKQQKGDCVSPRNTVPLRARQYIKCLSKRRNDANVRIANRLFSCGGGMSLACHVADACHVVDACLSCCVFHVLQITKEKWMICFGEVLRGALRYLDAKIIYHAPHLQVKPKIFRRLGFHFPPVGCIAHGCAFGSMLHSALRQGCRLSVLQLFAQR